MNIIFIIIDSLRKDHVGAYGNQWIHTPNVDAFAKESVVFNRCFPESLPTLPFRKALFTGKRTFPYRGHKMWKGDFQHAAPGWGPIPEEQDTLAEGFSHYGYKTALITDTYHYFKPSKNFHRGFQEWAWIRGQETDPYRTGPTLAPERIRAHLTEAIQNYPILGAFSSDLLGKYLRNVSERKTEKDYFAPQVFSRASQWILENQDPTPFFLVVDSFDPHEPWDPPADYRRLYDEDDDVIEVIHSIYGPYAGLLSPRELKRLQANYAGKVTLMDRWLGKFLETLRAAGRMDDSMIFLMSDHGHNLGIEPGDKGIISKQGQPMTHAVADLVMMMRDPQGEGAGTYCDALCYNVDITSTVLAMLGVTPPNPIDGVDLRPWIKSNAKGRDYVTVGYGPIITTITDQWWYNASIWGESPLLYKINEDPNLVNNLAAQFPEVCEQLRMLAVKDAGGQIPESFKTFTWMQGCSPLIGDMTTPWWQ
jgi:arylsulfatase A-like enzyme